MSWLSRTTPSAVEPPPPWQKGPFLHAGGVYAIGFSETSDLVLVITHSGGGVFDPLTGKKLYRDADWQPDGKRPPDGNRMHGLTTRGIGPLQGHIVFLAGIAGGGLLRATEDGWMAEVGGQGKRPDGTGGSDHLILTAPSAKTGICIHVDALFHRCAFGFSPSGRILAYAAGDGVHVWHR